MNKQYLLSVIDKYHLNGIVERTKWSVRNNTLNVKFLSEGRDLIGEIFAEGFDTLNNQEIAIFNTSQLYKLISITGQLLDLSVKNDGKTSPKLLIADNQFNLEYVLSDLTRVPKGADVDEPEYAVKFDVTKELIEGFIKAKKALPETELVSIESMYDSTQNKVISFTIGNDDNHSNKINFITPATQMDIPSNAVLFNANYIKEIFNNNKDFVEGKGYLNEDGLLKFTFINKEKITSNYYTVARG